MRPRKIQVHLVHSQSGRVVAVERNGPLFEPRAGFDAEFSWAQQGTAVRGAIKGAAGGAFEVLRLGQLGMTGRPQFSEPLA